MSNWEILLLLILGEIPGSQLQHSIQECCAFIRLKCSSLIGSRVETQLAHWLAGFAESPNCPDLSDLVSSLRWRWWQVDSLAWRLIPRLLILQLSFFRSQESQASQNRDFTCRLDQRWIQLGTLTAPGRPVRAALGFTVFSRGFPCIRSK